MRNLLLAIALIASGVHAEDWGPLQFLVGHWVGDGSGEPGKASGEFSFAPDLQGKVLVRKSFAAYPPQNGKPAYRHDDLMIVYRDSDSRRLQAVFFDSEGHTIRYGISPADGGVVFVSDGAGGQPRFRLTYTGAGKDRLKLTFEIAVPGKDFAKYLEASAHRE